MELEEIFTPSAPLENKNLFFGRTEEFELINDILKEPGGIPVIVGSRGVGKTSLGKVFLDDIKRQSFVTCSKETTFDELSRRILWNLGIDVYIRESSKEKEGNVTATGGINPLWKFAKLEATATFKGKTITHRLELGSKIITKDLLFQVLVSFKDKFYIHIDEFDRLYYASSEVKSQIGDLIKDLADHSNEHSCKIIISGIGSGAKDLFKGHRSINRQLREIYLRPLVKSDIKEFLLKGARLAKYNFTDDVLETIIFESDGFPYAVHLVALESCRAARKKGEKIVNLHHLEIGRDRAIKYAYRDYLDKFKSRIESLSICESKLIQYINRIRTMYIERENLRINLTKKDMSQAEFDNSWDALQNRCSIIYEHPSKKNKFLFTDPLLRPFLKMQFGYPKRKKCQKIDNNHPTLGF